MADSPTGLTNTPFIFLYLEHLRNDARLENCATWAQAFGAKQSWHDEFFRTWPRQGLV